MGVERLGGAREPLPEWMRDFHASVIRDGNSNHICWIAVCCWTTGLPAGRDAFDQASEVTVQASSRAPAGASLPIMVKMGFDAHS